MSRKIRMLVVAMLVLVGAAVGVPAALAAPTATACAMAWGSLPEETPRLGGAPVVDVRTGTDRCWDRVVFEVEGPVGGHRVKYVDEVIDDPSTDVLPVPGGARLEVLLHHPAYDSDGNPTLVDQVGVTGYRTLRSVVRGASFEGDTIFGVGVRAQLPFRVFTLAGPGSHSRIVLDVAHSWS